MLHAAARLSINCKHLWYYRWNIGKQPLKLCLNCPIIKSKSYQIRSCFLQKQLSETANVQPCFLFCLLTLCSWPWSTIFMYRYSKVNLAPVLQLPYMEYTWRMFLFLSYLCRVIKWKCKRLFITTWCNTTRIFIKKSKLSFAYKAV